MTARFPKTCSAVFVFVFVCSVAATASAKGQKEAKRSDESSNSAAASRNRDSEKTESSSKSEEPESSTEAGEGSTKTSKKKQPRAEAEVDADTAAMPMSLALLGSFGPSSEYLRGGLGLRGGLHFDGSLPFYFGGILTYFFGHQNTAPAQLGEASGSSVDRGFMYFGAEAGVDLSVIKDVTLRPYLGLGLGRSSEESCGGTGDCVTTARYPLTISPAVAGFYDLGAGLFAGADIRFLVAAGASDVSGPILSATLGFKF